MLELNLLRILRPFSGYLLHGLPMAWNEFDYKGLRDVYWIDDCAQALGAKGIGKTLTLPASHSRTRSTLPPGQKVG